MLMRHGSNCYATVTHEKRNYRGTPELPDEFLFRIEIYNTRPYFEFHDQNFLALPSLCVFRDDKKFAYNHF